jgi:phosphate starvation-inducible PhoH-like protein
MTEKIINVTHPENLVSVFGSFDSNLKKIEQRYNVAITLRGNEVKISGGEKEVGIAGAVLSGLLGLSEKGEPITPHTVRYSMDLADDDRSGEVMEIADGCICVTSRGRPVKARTVGQKKYIDIMKSNIITISVGPAGTGKTYLAVAMAVNAFMRKEINRIVLTRPAVEAGEKLGFLPGDLQNKVDPYLRPLYDALFDMFGAETYQKYLERGMIEVAPLAYMRGRTLDDSFIILDEAQNTTPEQMKMFLTRLGNNSRAVITGDITQIDLPPDKKSGLKEAIKILKGVEDIGICILGEKDVVRHELVQRIVKAYEKQEKREHKESIAIKNKWKKK